MRDATGADPNPGDEAAATAMPAPAPSADSQQSRTTVVAIIISVFLMGAGMGLQGSAVALRAGIEGFSDSMIGIIMSFNYVGLIIEIGRAHV